MAEQLRTPIRSMFTRAVKDFETEWAKATRQGEEPDLKQLTNLFRRVELHRENLLKFNDKVETALSNSKDVNEEKLMKEYEKVTEYENTFISVQLQFEEITMEARSVCQPQGEIVPVRSVPLMKRSKLKLEKLSIHPFNGDPHNWLKFWSQFRSVDEDKELLAEEKFQYLIQSTVEGSPAREVVESFPLSRENYPKVVDYLKSRFGDKELLVELYVRDLMKMVNASSECRADLITLYDKLETQLRALESMGMARKEYSFMLYPLVQSALPIEIDRTWQRLYSQVSEDEKKKTDKLTRLMDFLKVEVTSEIRVTMSKEDGEKETALIPKSQMQSEHIPAALELFNGSSPKECIFCGKSNHPSPECFKAKKMTNEQRQGVIKDKKACFACLQVGHGKKSCRSKVQCVICDKRHQVIMCPSRNQVQQSKGERKKKAESLEEEKQTQSNINSNADLGNHVQGQVFLQTLLVQLKGPLGMKRVRAIMDSGSQKSYVSVRAVQALGFQPKRKIKVTHALFGGSELRQVEHGEYEVEVSDEGQSYTTKITVLDQPKICGDVTRITHGPWIEELEKNGIKISDLGDGQREIHLLIGADVIGRLLTGKVFQTGSGPVGVGTRLGWTVMGAGIGLESRNDSSLLVTTLHVSDVNIQDLWRLDLLGIMETPESKNREDLMKSAAQHFSNTVKVNNDGRFEVSLPWIDGHPPVPVNRELAEKCLIRASEKLNQDMYAAYDKVFNDWLQEGIIEEITDSREECSYLPHRPVVKLESSTTPIRPVFNASAKPKDSPSLNQCLEKGPNLIELIPSILMRFRTKKYGVISDIRKAFLQIAVRPEDRDFLRFLWWGKDNKIIVFRHCRVVFGLTCSPFLLAATLSYHVEKFEKSYPTTVEHLKKSMYVDNCILAVDSPDDVDKFIQESQSILKLAKFDLRGWISNSPRLELPTPVTPLLGMEWKVESDMLSLDLRAVMKTEQESITKRKMLSQAHKIFDPLGLVCPVTLVPKKLVQDLWKTKAGWDEPVAEHIAEKYEIWFKQLPELAKFEVKRNILDRKKNVSLHTFCDSSTYAYATCIYLRCEDEDGVSVNLVMARNRLSTVKKITIPRLELLACLIGVRLCEEVKKEMDLRHVPSNFWTDSSNALYWIQNNENWAEFVWNRVKEIRQLSKVDEWRHIPGVLNPADLPSRGCTVKQFLSSQWCIGPEWLYLPEEKWPRSEINFDLEIVTAEKRKTVVSAISTEPEEQWYLQFVNEDGSLDYARIVREARSKINVEPDDSLWDELKKAEQYLYKIIQVDKIVGEEKTIRQFNAFKDANGIYRVHSRILLREDEEDFRYPVLLHGDHPLTRMFVEQEHRRLYHCGLHVLLIAVREKLWVLGARRLARNVIRSCPRCKVFEAKRCVPPEAPLPVDRVRDATVFEITGMDLGGPLYLKDGLKSWFVVFTCAVYRAVHLELVTSLSTKALVGAMERFVSRRIFPATIYSDNGTNLVGVRNEFERRGINVEWKLLPPAAPWWGGWYERVVGMVKKLLVRILGTGSVDYEELITILANCERVINSRPLTYISEDPTDLTPLTPSMFLHEPIPAGSPSIQELQACHFGEEHRRRKMLLTQFKKRFRDEYLATLAHIGRKTTRNDVKIGDMVLIEVENKKRIFWPIARIVDLVQGKDGVCRVVKVQTPNGILTRALQRVYPLEVLDEKVKRKERSKHDDNEAKSSNPKDDTEKTEVDPKVSTRFGREVKKPIRFSD